MKYDIIIIGANSFVGSRFLKQYKEYFIEQDLKVLITARSITKVEKNIIDNRHIHFKELNVLDEKEVFQIVSTGKLVINFVGPYDLYSHFITKACASCGTHYIDITGEVNFAKNNIEKLDKIAKENKSKIVSFCGFDSIPSEYSTLLAIELAKKNNDFLKSVDMIYKVKGGFNGGTIKTSFDMNKKMSESDWKNFHYLTPKEEKLHTNLNSQRYLKEINSWVSPFFMEPINSKVVFQSLYLKNYENVSKDFIHRESAAIPFGFTGNYIFTKTYNTFQKALKSKTLSPIIQKLLPAPGKGPGQKAIDSGFISIQVIARLQNNGNFISKMYSEGDPGNKTTIKFLGSAMKAFVNGQTKDVFGVITPSICFDTQFIDFMKTEGIIIDNFKKLH